MPSDKTFKTRLGCDNCGNEDIREIRVRRRIIDFCPAVDSFDTPTFSAYERMNGSDRTLLLCAYCELPCLKVFWWKEEVEMVRQEQTDV